MLPEFTKGIIRENPLFVQLLGVCPALATTSSLTNALGMGAAFTAVLIGSNLIISALKKFIPANIRIPAYIVVIASLVTDPAGESGRPVVAAPVQNRRYRQRPVRPHCP